MATQQPHDKLFKQFLTRPDQVKAQLQAMLPASVSAKLVWDQLEPMPDSFIDPDLRWRHTDVLFKVPTIDGQETFIYVLLKHQSSPDPTMPLRMLGYLVRIWDRHLIVHGGSRLPPIFPVVVSHGERWSAPTKLIDLIDADPAIVAAFEQALQFEFTLEDLNTTDLAQLRARQLTPRALVVLMLLKSHQHRPITEVLTELNSELTEFGNDQPDLVSIWIYVHLTTDTPTSQLLDLADQLGPRMKEAYMTTAEMILAEGRTEGRAEGRAETLLQLLDLKFGPLTGTDRERVRQATPAELDEWTMRVLTATSLSELIDADRN